MIDERLSQSLEIEGGNKIGFKDHLQCKKETSCPPFPAEEPIEHVELGISSSFFNPKVNDSHPHFTIVFFFH